MASPGCATCASCSSAAASWGYYLNVEEARRDYAAADAHVVLRQEGRGGRQIRGHQAGVPRQGGAGGGGPASTGVRRGWRQRRDWRRAIPTGPPGTGRGRSPTTKALRPDLLDPAEQGTVRQRIAGEFERAKARGPTPKAADRLWSAGEREQAVALYREIAIGAPPPPQRRPVARRLYEGANAWWVSGRKAEARGRVPEARPEPARTGRAGNDRRAIEALEAAGRKKIHQAPAARYGRKVRLKAYPSRLYYTASVTSGGQGAGRVRERHLRRRRPPDFRPDQQGGQDLPVSRS